MTADLGSRYDYKVVQILADLRREAKVSQAAAAGALGMKRHDSVGAWETGLSSPNEGRQREGLFIYLLDTLRLRSSRETFGQVWSEVMVGQWGWKPLSQDEWRRAFPGHYTPPVTAPKPPPPAEPPPPTGFVGREGELEHFAGQLHDAGLAVIIGMPGVGKTSLAAALARRQAAGRAVFWHSFHAFEDASAILWKLAGFFHAQGQEDLWAMLQNAGAASGPRPALDLYIDYVVAALRGGAFVLCLDDYQEVDAEPLLNRLVERLCEVAHEHRLALILTARRTPPCLQPLDVEPLQGFRFSDALLFLKQRQADLDPGLARRLYEQTGGNPQILTLAVNALRRYPDPAALVERLELEKRVKEYLLAEVDRNLSDDEREAMIALALLDRPATARAVEAVLDGRRVQPALDALSERYLLNPFPGLPQWKYGQHAIVQAFYREQPSQRERQVMHGRAALHYERAERDPLRAARHYIAGELPEQAAPLLTANLWALVNRGESGLVRQLLEQLEPGPLAPALWATVNIALGEVYAFGREVESARARFVQGYEVARTLPQASARAGLYVQACRGLAALMRSTAPKEALDWVQRGLNELRSTEPAPDVAAGSEREPALGPEIQREGAGLCIEAGFAHINMAEFDDAIALLNEGLARLPAGADALRAAALMNLGVAYCTQGRAAEGIGYYRQALEVAAGCGDAWRVVGVRHNLGIEMEIAGDWSGAAAEYREALAEAERLGSRTPQTGVTLALGILHTKQGDYPGADEYLRRSVEMARRYALKRHLVASLASLADLRLRQGEPEAAAALLIEAEGLAGEMDAGDQLAEIQRNWALVHLAHGDLPAASAAVERSLALARALELDLEEGMTLRVLGQVYAAQGQADEACSAFEQSLARLDGHDPYEAARSRMAWGGCLAAWHGTARTTELLAEADREFKRLGAADAATS